LKYIVDEREAATLHEYMRGYLTLDPCAKPEEGDAYWLYSLYRDYPQLAALILPQVYGAAS